MRIVIVEDEINKLKKLKINASDESRIFYNKVIIYLAGAGEDINPEIVDRIDKEYSRLYRAKYHKS